MVEEIMSMKGSMSTWDWESPRTTKFVSITLIITLEGILFYWNFKHYMSLNVFSLLKNAAYSFPTIHIHYIYYVDKVCIIELLILHNSYFTQLIQWFFKSVYSLYTFSIYFRLDDSNLFAPMVTFGEISFFLPLKYICKFKHNFPVNGFFFNKYHVLLLFLNNIYVNSVPLMKFLLYRWTNI